MDTRASVIEIIYGALRGLNEELPEDQRVPLAEGTLLFGPDASLDSLSLVSVIVDVESGVGDRFGKAVSLTDDEAMSQSVSPFSSVSTLADYIVQLLERA
ncbi:acyl carrier protein [Piscinibacter koreensis]|uniref:Acyl carrier protein n=1 Tax=Piscinibacter koreensis TaxID=2742824 RepID=A0A7Y6TYL1_9BURK|nr:acyl carrier protein [Schlegelella koreensis]NUZ08196.1 acyl carrier protein [Schlegelella koreensis]